jgi:PAS domain S-box-containing protein
MSGTLVKDENGASLFMAATAIDITERKRMEEALRESEERYRALFESELDGVAVIDETMRVLLANKAAADMFGFDSAEELLVLDLFDYVAPGEKERILELRDDALAGNYLPSVQEFRCVKRSGEEIWVGATITVIEYQGAVAGLVSFRDITERKKMEKALSESEEKFRLLTERSLVGIYVIQDSKVVYVNPSLAETLGYESEEINGIMTPANIIHPDDIGIALERLGEILNGRGMSQRKAYRLIRKDGSLIYVEVYTLPVDYEGKPAVMGTLIDVTEQKNAEEQLRENEKYLNRAQQIAHFGSWIWDVEANRVEFSDEMFNILGITKEQFDGKPDYSINLVIPEDRARVQECYNDLLIRHETATIEYSIIRPDGSIRHLWGNGEIETHKNGKPERIIGTVLDVTDRKQAEEALRIFKTISDKARYGIAIVGLEGNVSYNNTAYAEMHGYTPDELIGKHLSIFHNEQQMEHVNRLIEQLKWEGSYVAEEVWHRRKDNTEFLALMSGTLVKDKNGAPLFMAATAIDITERKRTEEALKESEERYRNIVEMSPDGIVTLNVYGIVTSCNAAFVNLIGYPESEILGKHIAEIPVVKPSDIPVVTELFTTLLIVDRPETVEWQWTCKDGTKKVGEFHMGLIEEAGVTSGFQVVVRDITGYRQMEEERRRIERLESIGTLAGGIAHDFNNLLTGIMGNISLIRDYLEPGSKEAERLLEAERASLRARDLTQQLLTFARGGEPIKETIAVGRLIEDAANFALGGSKSACVIDIPENLWKVHADKGQVSEVINNLVINAAESMPGGGVINISARNRVFREESSLLLPKGNYIELSIEDHGVGIPEEDLARIYEPYFTTKTKGSGLGLATTYSIIKNHEGLITVDSTPGVGTTFHIYLPATRKSSILFEEEAEDIQSSRTGKILIMDDEEAIRRLLERALTEAGHDITTAKDGAEAIEQYVGAIEQGRPFDLVILDLTVPGGMGGMEAKEKLIEIDPDIKSIVSSGYSSDPIMADCGKYGFGAVIAKPYRVRELRRMILEILQQK